MGKPDHQREETPTYPFPLKHVLVFRWFFEDAKTVDELVRRLRENHFYVVRPRDDILVATSEARPALITFTFIKNRRDGGDLILIQAPWGWYSLGQILKYMQLFAKNAGISVEYAGPKRESL